MKDRLGYLYLNRHGSRIFLSGVGGVSLIICTFVPFFLLLSFFHMDLKKSEIYDKI